MLYDDVLFPVLPDRPYVYANFAMTMNGSLDFSQEGSRATSFGSSYDRAVLHTLRAHADALAHGRKTMRTMWAMNDLVSPEFLERRERLGKGSVLHYLVFASHLSHQETGYLMGKKQEKPIIITGGNGDVSQDVQRYADLLRCGANQRADLAQAMIELKHLGIHHLLLEGGQTLFESFLKADLVDEIFLTLIPTVAGNVSRIGQKIDPLAFRLCSHSVQADELFLRYLRNR